MASPELHILGGWGTADSLRGATDSAVLACVERLLKRNHPGDRALLIADEHAERRACTLGLATPLVAPPAVLRESLIRNPLRKLLARLERPSRVVCWNSELVGPIRSIVLSSWTSAIDVVEGVACEAQTKRFPAGRRETIRAALGLTADEHVLVLAADPPDALSAHDFVRAAALVSLVGRNVTAIVPRQAQEMDRAKSTLRDTGIPMRLMTSDAPVWALLPCADAVVVDVVEGSAPREVGPHAKRVMAETCARLGIPVVWPDAENFGVERLDRWVLRPRSRLAVHVARAINEFFLASSAAPLLESKARGEIPA